MLPTPSSALGYWKYAAEDGGLSKRREYYLTNESSLQGLIIKAQSGFFTVETSQGFIVCQLRGKLKQGRAKGDIAALGDRVRLTVLADGSGAIEEVEERKQAITRLDPRPQGEYQQVLLANADQAVFVFACAHPPPD